MRIGDVEILDLRELPGPLGPEMHIWVDDAPPRRSRTRDGHRRRGRDGDLLDRTDAAANAEGELKPGTVPPGGPSDPPLYGSEGDEEAPTAGGVTEGPFLDARSLRLTGRDQGGNSVNFGVHAYGRPGDPPEGSWPGAKPDELMTVNDHLPANLARFQAALTAHYRR